MAASAFIYHRLTGKLYMNFREEVDDGISAVELERRKIKARNEMVEAMTTAIEKMGYHANIDALGGYEAEFSASGIRD